jgi:hypothetical protein
MGPLSGKQQREWLKHQAKEARETAKMESEEGRKQALHQIKLQEAAAKANQGLGHKEELHGIKVNELGGPLSGKKPKINKQKLGIPTQNPLAGSEVFKQGQHRLPFAKGTDTVPAMLTPGEAVIPAPAAQDPRNKPLIKKMVQQGRRMQRLARGTTGVVDLPHQLAMIPKVGTRKKPMGYSNGTVEVEDTQRYMPDKYNEGSVGIVDPAHRHYNKGTTEVQYLALGDDEIGPKIPQGNTEIPFQSTVQNTNWYNEYMNEYGEPPDLSKDADYDYRKAVAAGAMPERSPEDNNRYHWPSSLPDGTMLKTEEHPTAWKEFYMRSTGVDPDTVKNQDEATKVAIADKYKANMPDNRDIGQPAPVPLSDVAAVPKQVQDDQYNPDIKQGVPAPQQMTVADVNNMDRRAEAQPAPVARSMATPEPVAKPTAAVPKIDRTDPNYWVTQLKGTQSQVDTLANKHGNDEKGFVDSFKNLFSYSGVKDILGLNNQEVARMALMYLGSRARGFDGARSLSFAGRNAFETSLQRQRAEAQERSADKRAAASADASIRSAAVQMAAQESRFQQEDKRAIEKDRKEEMTRLAGEKKALLAQFENDRDRYENFASKDVPMSVRNQAMKIAYAPLKSTAPEDRIQEQRDNLRQATVLLANSTIYKDPNSGRHDRSPKWGWYEDSKGNSVYAAPDPYGSGKMIVKNGDNFGQVGGETLKPEGTTAKQGKVVADITQQYLSGLKDDKGKPIDTAAVGVKIMTAMQDFPGIASNVYRANPAIQQTVELLARDESKDYSADAVRKAFAASAVMTLTPTNSPLFMTPGRNAKPVSGKSAVEFGGALLNAKDKNGNPVPLEASSKFYIDKWNEMPLKKQNEFNVLAKDGYSGFQKFVIDDIKNQK